MIRYVCALALGALLTTPAQAVEINFQGFWLIRAAAGACNDYNPVGDRGIARMRVRQPLDPDRSDHELTIFKGNNTQGYRLDGSHFNTTHKSVETIYVGRGWGPDDSVEDVFVRFNSQSPATIAANTPFVNIVGQITNYDFMPGCQVTFYLTLTLLPNNL